MTAELLTDEELTGLRLHSLAYPLETKLLRAYEYLVQQVETLTIERDQARKGWKDVTAIATADATALATERAAREAAEREEVAQIKRAQTAESERDTALARVKQLERERDDLGTVAYRQEQRALAAESALASARSLAIQYENDRLTMQLERDQFEIWLDESRALLRRWTGKSPGPLLHSDTTAWLSSHPAAAPTATEASKTIERLPPRHIPEEDLVPVAAPRKHIFGEDSDCENCGAFGPDAPTHCGDPLCDFDDCGEAPAAARCADEHERDVADTRDDSDRITELEQAIDAAVAELDYTDNRPTYHAKQALAVLRAARGGGS